MFVKAGDRVKAGDALMVMIAMKMEVRHEFSCQVNLRAPGLVVCIMRWVSNASSAVRVVNWMRIS